MKRFEVVIANSDDIFHDGERFIIYTFDSITAINEALCIFRREHNNKVNTTLSITSRQLPKTKVTIEGKD